MHADKTLRNLSYCSPIDDDLMTYVCKITRYNDTIRYNAIKSNPLYSQPRYNHVFPVL
jgi:hypothetical protein